MSVIIRGRTVKVNDPLYHIGFRTWGIVEGFDVGSAKLRIQGSNNQSRIVYVQNGGLVNGNRVIYWHEPLVLDVPYQNVSKYQAILDAVVGEFPT